MWAGKAKGECGRDARAKNQSWRKQAARAAAGWGKGGIGCRRVGENDGRGRSGQRAWVEGPAERASGSVKARA